jgi:hypothetical protein
MEKKYNLITKGVRDVGDIKKGKVHILGGLNQVPFKVKKILIGKDIYPITPEMINVGAKARLTVFVDKEYSADTDVFLIGDRIEVTFIGKNQEDRYNTDFSDKKNWKEYFFQTVLKARIVNADYQENWSIQLFSNIDNNGNLIIKNELICWSCPDDIPINIKGIFIETENPDDKKYIRVYDVKVGKDSQLINSEDLPIESLHHIQTQTCNVGQLLTITLHNIFSEPCSECGKLKTRPISITGYVLGETPNPNDYKNALERREN